MTSFRRIAAALTAAGIFAVAAPASVLASTLITESGSTAEYPLIQALANKYTKLQHHAVRFRISQGGSSVGVNEVNEGRVNVGMVAREPLGTDPTGLDFYPFAKYAVCIVTNAANTLPNLTTAQAVAIFTGKTRSWSEVPGATAPGTIELFSRTSVAGVLTNFQTLLLEGKKVSTIATEESTENLLAEKVGSNVPGIGFLSNYTALDGPAHKKLHAVEYNGVECNLKNAESGAYQGVARFYEVTKGRATGAEAKFISWIERSAAAKKIISSEWLPIGK
jgi:phosphate transport system substrate-binding protein